MDGAGNAVAAQAGQAEDFGHNALTGERRIAMQQQRHHLDAFAQRDDVAFPDRRHLVLFGPGLAHHHRVDNFKMRGIGRQRQMHLVAIKLAVR